MLGLFQICFYTGILFTMVSFLMGQLFDFLNLDIDLDMDGDLFGISIAPIKPIIMISFITTLGGIGILCIKKGFSSLSSFIIAFLIALCVAILLHKFIVTPLYKAQNTSAISQEQLLGYTAKTKVSMIGDNFGSITYVVNGNTHSSPAKSISGLDIYKGEEVRIVSIDKNIFYVARV